MVLFYEMCKKDKFVEIKSSDFPRAGSENGNNCKQTCFFSRWWTYFNTLDLVMAT